MPPAGGSFSPSPSLQGESGEEVENVAVEASHSRVNDLSRKLAAKPLGLCRGPPGREGAPPFERFRFGGRGETNAAGALHVPEQKRQRLGSIYDYPRELEATPTDKRLDMDSATPGSSPVIIRRKVLLESDTDGDTPDIRQRRRRPQLLQDGEDEDEALQVKEQDGTRGVVIEIDDDEEEGEGQARDGQILIIEDVLDKGEQSRGSSLVERCEEISMALRKQLGGSSIRGDRWCETEEKGGGAQLASAEDLVQACGEVAEGLKPYQLAGINFMMLLKRAKVPGAILADEMGLGKTAQTICFLGLLRTLENDPGPHLVVAPASLLENWRRELSRWCPDLCTTLYYGADRRQLREDLLWRKFGERPKDSDADSDIDFEAIEEEDGEKGGRESLPFNVMLTGYSIFERDSLEQKLDREFLRKWKWSHLVLDEAHALKNRNASRTVRLRKISRHCKRRIMLTGTPLQNDLGELRGLLEFLLPDLFGEANEDDLGFGDEDEDELAVDQMKAILAPFIMRRLKSEVARQLTQKVQEVEYVEMEGAQADLYRQTVAAWCAEVEGRKLSSKAGTKETTAALLKRAGARNVKHVFTELRKIAHHPLLSRHHFRDEDLQEIARLAHSSGLFGSSCSLARVSEELRSYSDFQIHTLAAEHPSLLGRFTLDPQLLCSSAKFRALERILRELQAAGSRPLIFSQWTTCLDLIGCLMDHMGLSYLRLDGSTEVKDRLELCDQFNDPGHGVFAFMLSTRAGGQGLNLTGADTVIIHDVDFNPQIDRQAEDRSHRLGQTRPVTVIRLVTRGTVDEDILAIAERKLALDAAVLSGCTAEVGGDGSLAVDEGSVQAELMRRILERGA